MAEDDDLLERELSWTDPDPRRLRASRPARPEGTNVMFALTGILALVGITLYLGSFGPVNTERGIGPVVAFLTVSAIWFFVSSRLSRWLWVAIGPVARALLRPIGVLGPLLTALILLVVWGTGWAVMQQARQSNSLEEFLNGGPLQGDDWRVDYQRQGNGIRLPQVTFAEAQAHCAELGSGWRLPRSEDRPLLNQKLKAFSFRSGAYHATPDDPGRIWHLRYEKSEGGFRLNEVYPEQRSAETVKAATVCILDAQPPSSSGSASSTGG